VRHAPADDNYKLKITSMDLNFFGKQGSGKGTQAKVIAKRLCYRIFETGGALRDIAKKKTALGKKVKEIMNKGELVPTKVVIEVLEDFIKSIEPGEKIIFDGIPRSTEQKIHFDRIINKHKRVVQGILISISDKEALYRLSNRMICQDCSAVYGAFYKEKKCEKCGGELGKRSDDVPEAIQKRLELFAEETVPVIKSYRRSGDITEINGKLPVEMVTQKIMSIVIGRDYFLEENLQD